MKRKTKIETPEVRTTEVCETGTEGVWVTKIKEVISSKEITDYDEPLEGAKKDFIFCEHSTTHYDGIYVRGISYYYSSIMKGEEIINHLTEYKDGTDICLKDNVFVAIVEKDNSVEFVPAALSYDGANALMQLRPDREYRISCLYIKPYGVCYLNINKTNYKYHKKKFRIY